nr:vWA domain-containing protein [Saprospiraceae bacterium]
MKNFLFTITALMCCYLPASAQHDSNESPTAALTVANWNDLAHWEDWQQHRRATFQADADKWPLPLHQRYRVLVKSLSGQPVRNCTVQLLDNSGEALWLSQTNALGQAELWCKKDKKAEAIRVYFQEQAYTVDSPQPFEKGVNHFSIPAACQPPAGIDVFALVDATHSMRDEFDAVIRALAKSQEKARETTPDFKIQSMLFRDYGERFLTLPIELAGEAGKRDFRWQAAGGGNEMEPIDTALMVAIQSHNWRPEADARLLLFFTDAIPKTDKGAAERLAKALKLAS